MFLLAGKRVKIIWPRVQTCTLSFAEIWTLRTFKGSYRTPQFGYFSCECYFENYLIPRKIEEIKEILFNEKSTTIKIQDKNLNE